MTDRIIVFLCVTIFGTLMLSAFFVPIGGALDISPKLVLVICGAACFFSALAISAEK